MHKSISLLIVSFLGLSSITQAQDTTFWQQKYAPSWRHVLATQIVDDDVFVGVGGWYQDDSITTIYHSSDAGANWGKKSDGIGPILQDVHFPEDSIGYTVGWDGGLWKSTDYGANWNKIQISGNSSSRHFNGCYFLSDQVGFIVGGNPSNDAISTILKTDDGGDSWGVQVDALGPWLHSIDFATADTGIAVGEGGTVYRTTDGGSNWNLVALQGNLSGRDYKAITMANSDLGLMVGGWLTMDSIQTLLRTTDGGATWSIIYDNMGSMLHGADFVSNSLAYVAGDDGVVLKSEDGGQSWTTFTISGIVDAEFRAVRFRSEDQGIISGHYGMLLMYNDTTDRLADISLDSLLHRTSETTAELTGTIQAKGFNTQMWVEYGEAGQFDQTGDIDPSSTSSTNTVSFSIDLDGLTPGKVYEVRVKAENDFGVTYSNIVSFYSGGTPIPNYSFELWDDVTISFLDDWNENVGVRRVTSGDGSKAAQLFTKGTEPGLLFIGASENGQFVGGMPCPVMPDSLKLDINYDISEYDSAIILSYFKKAGVGFHTELFYISGSSNNQFEQMTRAYTYAGSEVPDSIVLAIVNTNALAGKLFDSSLVNVDNIEFIASQGIPIDNHDFEDWTDVDYNVLQSWATTDRDDDELGRFTEQSTDAFRGEYALHLKNDIGVDHAQIVTGDKLGQDPDFPVDRAYSDFIMHLKWFPQDGDTLVASINMYSEGENVGNALAHFTDEIDTYEQHILPVWYWNSAPVDSCQIHFAITNYQSNPSGSYAIIDHLSFESLFSSVKGYTPPDVLIYPNPTEDQFHIQLPQHTEDLELIIRDLSGRVVLSQNIGIKTKVTIDAGHWSPGIYTVQIYGQQIYFISKISKQ